MGNNKKQYKSFRNLDLNTIMTESDNRFAPKKQNKKEQPKKVVREETEKDLEFSKKGHQKNDGPEAAENFEEQTEEQEEFTMNKQQMNKENATLGSSFDELYNKVINEEEDIEDIEDLEDLERNGDVEPGMGDEVVEPELPEDFDPSEAFAAISSQLNNLKKYYGFAEPEEYMEAVEAEYAGHPLKGQTKGNELQNPGNKDTKGVKVTSRGDKSNVHINTDGTPKKFEDKGEHLKNTKNFTVDTEGPQKKGKSASAFEES